MNVNVPPLRFRNLYMMSQTQISGVKQTLSAAQAKKPPSAEQDAIVKNLTRTMQIHSNIHTVVKASVYLCIVVLVFMKKLIRGLTFFLLVIHTNRSS